MTTFPPLTHVALTVRDLSVSVPWYEALLDADPVIDEDTDPQLHHTVYLIGNGTLIGLHQHEKTAPAGNFSEYNVGLDHISFGCASRSELEKWAGKLDELGITHGGIKDASYGSGLSFRDPDGIALKFSPRRARNQRDPGPALCCVHCLCGSERSTAGSDGRIRWPPPVRIFGRVM